MMKQTTVLEAVLRADGLLLQGIGRNVDILGISNDSRTVKPGDLFVCKGYGFKPEYLAKAREAGAVCYLAQEKLDSDLPVILVSDVRKAQSLAAQWFYDYPSRTFTLVGITGTKGKTTTTYMTRAVMDPRVSGNAAALCRGPGAQAARGHRRDQQPGLPGPPDLRPALPLRHFPGHRPRPHLRP